MSLVKQQLAHGWTFQQQGWASDNWLPVAQVPSQVHIDLLANKKIPDPFVDFNERAVQWVGEKTWIYRLEFVAPVAPDASMTSDLVFDGLDTFSTVHLNGNKILETENMFVSYRVNVSQYVKPGENNCLEIVFDSALLRGRELIEKHSHEHNFLVRQTEAGRVPVRKAQYHWGWDWGPILMTAGPWKPVFFEQYIVRISDIWAQNTVSNDLKACTGTIFAKVDGAVSADTKVKFSLELDDTVVFQGDAQVEDGTAKLPFTMENPHLWYPLNYGPQTRYKLTARVVGTGGKELDAVSRLTGFRKTALIQEPDAYGKSFYFRINNIDVFAGGSCWIPADSFLAQVPAQRYHDWVKLMADGNQVMVRVWGGGVYEDDAFLDACDELGVLVWHDFQFACASYPAYDSFLQNFELEARQQVQRMRWRPAVIIWAGNNEDYQVQERYKLDYDFENKDPEAWRKSTFPARYVYEHLLPKIMSEEDPHNIYHPSSPWGDGKPTADPTVGDIHQWNLWHGAMNKYQEADQLGGRFVSEFGMEAYPHLSTTRLMASQPSQLHPGSMVLDFHNKGIGHERRMMTYVAENFRVRRADDLAAYTHLTQVVQAETMRAAYKAWRRDWGAGDGRGRRCGGVLVWQLNDCWPTVSWAVADYRLVRKPAWYAVARALRPVDVGVARTYHDWTQTGYDIDANSALRTGRDVRPATTRRGVRLRANGTTEIVVDEPLAASIPEGSAEDEARPFDTEEYDPYVVHARLMLDDGAVVTDTAWPDPVKFLDMADRGVSFEVADAEGRVTVAARRPVKGFVFEEVEGLKLSDNGFDLLPGEEQVVTVAGPLKPSELRWTHIEASGPSLPIE
ncbi:glycoside hydrolase family 2 protein [Cordyceps fumosorosea ARSEF 2679]|uniref:Beta-mannosidase B n=1 Tax=Cordyceps fumosorosea (strain ARSEF 2679) TaxID=1081104 RepID=A0A168EKG2_CORFA|nr:glycoside hydrolase family 2 protein [Cordyceps fumosorosea ARSEF 2679]OAA73921.1 glycoside hydrolase family 2 protein [Cordyceps fumosorosea ARSEF 2679]